jgi:hypothetical protein
LKFPLSAAVIFDIPKPEHQEPRSTPRAEREPCVQYMDALGNLMNMIQTKRASFRNRRFSV